MLQQDPFATFLSDMAASLRLVEELEDTLDRIHHKVEQGCRRYDEIDKHRESRMPHLTM